MITVSIEEVKTYLDNDSYSDARIQQAIDMAVSRVKRIVWYDIFDSGSKTELANGTGHNIITTKRSPIIAVASVSHNSWTSDSPVWDAISPSEYHVLEGEGAIAFNYRLSRWYENYQVVYTAWFADNEFPQEILLATYALVSQILNSAGAQGIKSETVGGASVTFSDEEDPTILKNLFPFKRLDV